MNNRTKRRLKRILATLVIVYIVGGVVLYFIQDLLLFRPKALAKEHQFSFSQPFEEVNIAIGENNLSIVKFKPDSNRKGIVLFYHGNMKNVEHYEKYHSLFTRNSYEIWMIDYPGFGKTTGKRTEQLIYEQAVFMYDLATKEINADSLVIYGKSIGTGIAAYVASNKKCKRLVLETPYYSIDALAKFYFPIYPSVLTKYSFPTYKFLQATKSPITIFHGTDDEIIPYKHAEWLKKEKPGIELVAIKKGRHNDLYDFGLFQQKIDSILAR